MVLVGGLSNASVGRLKSAPSGSHDRKPSEIGRRAVLYGTVLYILSYAPVFSIVCGLAFAWQKWSFTTRHYRPPEELGRIDKISRCVCIAPNNGLGLVEMPVRVAQKSELFSTRFHRPSSAT